jgi:ABC-2 type transport system ATP-binding protein
VPEGLAGAVRRTGSIVETPALFPTMTARENLRLLARIDGIGSGPVDGALELVGLAERADDLVKRYSLGMRQRLGIAAALMKDPELLILDEPANGLDPAGMREVRGLLRRLASQGRTVFLSSHLLAEVEQTCDRVAIVAKGRCIRHGTVDEVVSTAGRSGAVLLKVADLDAGARVLRTAGFDVGRVDGALRVGVDAGQAADLTRLLAGAGQWISELRPDRLSLEEVFLELTGQVGAEHEPEGVAA